MKKCLSLLFSLVLIGIICSSCIEKNYYNDKETIDGTGELIEKEVGLSSFNRVTLVGTADIKIVKGDVQRVLITAQSNILDVMVHEVSDGTLKVGFKNDITIRDSKGIYIDIITPSGISDVSITGEGQVTVAGDLQEVFNIKITGAGDVNGFNLPVENCSVTIAGAGNCNVHVVEHLGVNISGIGTVNFKGHPEVVQTIAGIGNINDAN